MKDEPRRRRRGGRGRGGEGTGRPTRPLAEPRPPRSLARDPRQLARPQQAAPSRRRRGARPRSPDDLTPGTPCVILFDCREGEPDRTGEVAAFDGFFDPESGEGRRSGGVPRLRVASERVWGFEVWWRPDLDRRGYTEIDRTDLETSKRLLRGLVRDARGRRPLVAR